MMEKVTLSASEQKTYAELFVACDPSSSGRVANAAAYELFQTSQLPVETIHQITELCGAQRLGHFGRSQFYIALKLIAAAQVGLPLIPDSFNSGIDIPLPKFSRAQEGGMQCQLPVQPAVLNSGRQDFVHHHEVKNSVTTTTTSVHLPPPPANKVVISRVNQHPADLKFETEELPQFLSTQMSQVGEGGGGDSPGSSPSDVTTPTKLSSSSVVESPPPTANNTTNSTHIRTDKSWAAFQKRTEGQDAQQMWDQFDEDRQLLGTEEESSDRHSSDEECDIWSITEEQREYYTNQFKSMQPDLHGLLSGVTAKDFFEKSKLPVQELSKIWQLSDVNKDGALSLEEFFTAMHLVVLRRNNIDLPKVLPPSLVPKMTKQQSEVITDVQSGRTGDSPLRSPTEASSPHAKEWTRFNDSPTSSLSSPGSKPVNFDFQKSALEQDPKIFHPVPLRMSPDSQVVSDENEVTCPDNASTTAATTNATNNTYEVLAEQKSPSKRLVNSESQEFKTGVLPQTAIQRPVPKKPAVPGPGAIPPPPQAPVVPLPPGMEEGVDGQVSVGAFPASSSTGAFPVQQSQAALPQGPKKEPPPPPPPRPKKNHARSSSLDLNRLGAPPAVPPRMSPSTMTPKKLVGRKSEPDVVMLLTDQLANFADFAQFAQDYSSSDAVAADAASTSDVLQFKAGAFEVYKRPELNHGGKTTAGATTSLPGGLLIKSPDAAISKEDGATGERWVDGVSSEKRTSLTVSRSPTKLDKPSLRTAIRVQREQNTMLNRLNSELNQELSEVMEERIALEIQLEHLKPFST